MHMRPFSGMDDLAKMKNLVRAGLRVSPHFGYPQATELDWWVCYCLIGENWPDLIMLWEDAGEVVGWVLADVPPYYKYELALHPDLRESDLAEELITWGEECITPAAKADGKPIEVLVWQDETVLRERLERRGYKGSNFLVSFERSLEGPLPEPTLPEGYSFLETMKPEWADRRADLHVHYFTDSNMTPAQFVTLMDSPDYDPALDVIVVAPDGTFAASAIVWVDPQTGLGSFEPVGTRTALQRRGLGRAVMHEGLRRMQARGMKTALVKTGAEQLENIAFYTNCGFTLVTGIMHYEKQTVSE